jgi:hypothetical protein
MKFKVNRTKSNRALDAFIKSWSEETVTGIQAADPSIPKYYIDRAVAGAAEDLKAELQTTLKVATEEVVEAYLIPFVTAYRVNPNAKPPETSEIQNV